MAVEFENQTSISSTQAANQNTKKKRVTLEQKLINWGIAKNTTQANIYLVIFAIICIVLGWMAAF